MTVTKQQQLEWLAKNKSDFNFDVVIMSTHDLGEMADIWNDSHYKITREEWQQERDKMQKQQDNSLRKRWARPPIGAHVELWFGGSFAYNCEFICVRGRNYIVWNLDADRPDCADIMNSEFRPLRTEREKAIDEMSLLAIGCEKYAITQNAAKAVCELLYDAGCRMVKP